MTIFEAIKDKSLEELKKVVTNENINCKDKKYQIASFTLIKLYRNVLPIMKGGNLQMTEVSFFYLYTFIKYNM